MDFFLWCFDPIPIQGLALQGFAITHWTHHTLPENTQQSREKNYPCPRRDLNTLSQRPQTHALDSVTTGIGQWENADQKFQ